MNGVSKKLAYAYFFCFIPESFLDFYAGEADFGTCKAEDLSVQLCPEVLDGSEGGDDYDEILKSLPAPTSFIS